MSGMSPRERVRAALDHREPDRIPFDLGGSRVTGIHVQAYARLRAALGLPVGEARVGDITQQLAEIEPDVLDALGCDVRAVGPRSGSTYHREMHEEGEYQTFVDEWGVGRRMLRAGGLYYDSYAPPLGGDIDYMDEVTLGYALKGRMVPCACGAKMATRKSWKFRM